MEFVLNGQSKTYAANPDLSLLTYLREIAGIISPKDGCSSEGICGCCTILVDQVARLSCRMKMKDVADKQVTTLEGLSSAEKDAFADAFVLKGGVQCGFCTPGIVMKAKAILDKNPNPTRQEITDGLSGNICRCTGYKKVVDSIECAAEALREGRPVKVAEGTGKIGSRHGKYTGREAVLGERVFVADMKEPGMVYGALRFSDHPRARVLRIDISEALLVRGVVRILTAKDVPGKRIVGMIFQDWPVMVAEGEITRYIGDVLANVAASTEEAAREAAARIKVDYEELQPVTDIFQALKPDSPQITEKGNVLSVSEVSFGDADEALKSSAFVTRHRFATQRIEHAFLEMEATLALSLGKGRPARRKGLRLRPGRLRRSQATVRHARSAGAPGERGAGAERRRVRRQGGPDHPRPRGIVVLAHGSPRDGAADPRRIPPHASQAASHRHGIRPGLR